MKDYWEKLSFIQKLNHIFWGVVGLLILIFALLNWQIINVHFIFGKIEIPVTILIFLSMFGGYGYAKLFGYFKTRKMHQEVSYLKGELAATRHKVKKPIPTPSTPPKIETDTETEEAAEPEGE